jgi:L-ascorbate metabolism protein UlaG (beta-lactamase superfamily)
MLLLLLLVGVILEDHLAEEVMPQGLEVVVHMHRDHLHLEVVKTPLLEEMVQDTLFLVPQLIMLAEEVLMDMQLSALEDKVVVEQVELQIQ